MTSDCVSGGYDFEYTTCYLAVRTDGICLGQQNDANYYVSEPVANVGGDGLIVFNGNCGYLYYGGVST